MTFKSLLVSAIFTFAAEWLVFFALVRLVEWLFGYTDDTPFPLIISMMFAFNNLLERRDLNAE